MPAQYIYLDFKITTLFKIKQLKLEKFFLNPVVSDFRSGTLRVRTSNPKNKKVKALPY
jgi:hypothetical protein